MSLKIFPVEILSQILNAENSWGAIELWKCGDHVLNSKLANRGIEVVDLFDDTDSDGYSSGRWPKCLKFFKLVKLSVRRPGGLCTPTTLCSELMQLHSGIEELVIEGCGAAHAFFPFQPRPTANHSKSNKSSTKASKSLENAAQSKSRSMNGTESSSEVDWNKIFPHLKILKIGGESHPRNIDDRLFALLPRKLTTFEFNRCRIGSPAMQDFSSIPKSLTFLDLPYYTITKNNLAKLPKHIKTLGTCLETSAMILLAKKPSLLPRLTVFPWAEEIGSECPLWDLYYDEDMAWPANLTEISYSQKSALSFGIELPDSLTSLNVGNSCGKYDVFASGLSGLPRGLVKISFCSAQWRKINPSDWPASLTELRVTFDDKFRVNDFCKLPRALKILHISGGGGYATPYIYPFNLENLLQSGRELIRGLDSDHWSLIKQRITSSTSKSSYKSSYIDAIESGALFGLPLSLTTFRLGKIINCTAADLLMPPLLRSLVIESNATNGSFNFFDLLPSSLTSIKFLRPESKCSVEPLDTYNGLISAHPSMTPFYHLNLTSLSIELIIAESASTIIELLPRSLRNLGLASIKSRLTSDDILKLPQKLESLVLKCRSLEPRNNWAHTLPLTLHTLDIDGGVLVGDEVVQLPPKLTSLDAPIYGVSLSHIMSMPRGLRRVKVTPMYANLKESWSISELSVYNWRTLISIYKPFHRLYEAGERELLYELVEADKVQSKERLSKKGNSSYTHADERWPPIEDPLNPEHIDLEPRWHGIDADSEMLSETSSDDEEDDGGANNREVDEEEDENGGAGEEDEEMDIDADAEDGRSDSNEENAEEVRMDVDSDSDVDMDDYSEETYDPQNEADYVIATDVDARVIRRIAGDWPAVIVPAPRRKQPPRAVRSFARK